MTRRPARLAASAALVLLAAAGCGADSGDAESGDQPRPAARAASVDVADFEYRPAKLEVARGARVTWTNRDASPHTATAPGGLDTGVLRRGQARTLRLTRAGTYAYICELHPFMKASIVVRGEGEAS